VLAAFAVAFVLSFLASMPIAGPIAAIVVSKGLGGQSRAGFFIAIGAAFAEAFYAGLAFLGITAMVERYPLLLPISRLLGCLILIGLGVFFVVKKPKAEAATGAEPGAPTPTTTDVGSLFLGFSITALNPTLIVTWTGAVSAVTASKILRVHEWDAVPFALGVLLGIISWFSTLLALLARFKRKLQPTSVHRSIQGMGVFLVLLGVGFAVRTVLQWHSGV